VFVVQVKVFQWNRWAHTLAHTHINVWRRKRTWELLIFFFLLILLACFRCNRNGGEKNRSGRLLLWWLFYLQVRCHILDRLKQELAAMEDSWKCAILKSCPSERSREQWQHPPFGVRVTVKATEAAFSWASPMTVNHPLLVFQACLLPQDDLQYLQVAH